MATTTPVWFTCAGSRDAARPTRFWTSTAATSMSRVGSKVTVINETPSLPLAEVMYRIPSTPLSSCSIGIVTALSTTSELAPT